MIQKLLSEISTIYIAYGATDFRKQIPSLCAEVKSRFNLSPYKNVAFIFCNKKRNSIKVLCYDKNRIHTSTKNIIGYRKNEIQMAKKLKRIKKYNKKTTRLAFIRTKN